MQLKKKKKAQNEKGYILIKHNRIIFKRVENWKIGEKKIINDKYKVQYVFYKKEERKKTEGKNRKG